MAAVNYEEYHIIANAYDLPVGQSETAWYEGIDTNLKLIAAAVTGKAVLYKIRSEGEVLIVPYTAEFARKNTHGSSCNAASFMLPENKKAKNRTAQVAFSANIYRAGSACSKGPGSKPDSVLLHELLHAGRSLGLDAKHVPLKDEVAGYENEEEFFAILVQNIYDSETQGKKVQLRSDHGNGILKPPNDNDWTWMSVTANYDLVKKFCKTHTTIAPMIAKADATFNPIRVYYDMQKGVTPVRADIPTAPEPTEIRSDFNFPASWSFPSDALFDFDEPKPGTSKFKFSAAAEALFKGLSSAITMNMPERALLIKGHTDSIGSDDYNRGLSQRRANAVMQWFIDNKVVQPKDVSTQALGSSRPVVVTKDTKNTPENRKSQAKNRRVEIALVRR